MLLLNTCGHLLVYDTLAPVAAGADIKEMSKLTFADAYGQDKFNEWARLGKIRKPVRNAGYFPVDIANVCCSSTGQGLSFSYTVVCDVLVPS